MICYNQGPRSIPDTSTRTVLSLPNVGNCDHTYLHHTIQSYDSPPPVTLFLMASAAEGTDSDKLRLLMAIMRRTLETQSKSFITCETPLSQLYDFTMDVYQTQNPQNAAIKTETQTELCSIRPFGAWYESVFGETPFEYAASLV